MISGVNCVVRLKGRPLLVNGPIQFIASLDSLRLRLSLEACNFWRVWASVNIFVLLESSFCARFPVLTALQTKRG